MSLLLLLTAAKLKYQFEREFFSIVCHNSTQVNGSTKEPNI